MRIGGIEFVRSGEGLSPRGCPEFWFVTRDGMSAARWMGYWDVVFLPEDGSPEGNGSGGLREDGSDGRGRIFRRVSEAGEDGILIADLWERYFLLTPDGRRREVTAPLVL